MSGLSECYDSQLESRNIQLGWFTNEWSDKELNVYDLNSYEIKYFLSKWTE